MSTRAIEVIDLSSDDVLEAAQPKIPPAPHSINAKTRAIEVIDLSSDDALEAAQPKTPPAPHSINAEPNKWYDVSRKYNPHMHRNFPNGIPRTAHAKKHGLACMVASPWPAKESKEERKRKKEERKERKRAEKGEEMSVMVEKEA